MNIKEAIHLYLSYKESLGEKIRDVRYFLLRFERYINPIVELDEIKETDCQNFLNCKGRKIIIILGIGIINSASLKASSCGHFPESLCILSRYPKSVLQSDMILHRIYIVRMN